MKVVSDDDGMEDAVEIVAGENITEERLKPNKNGTAIKERQWQPLGLDPADNDTDNEGLDDDREVTLTDLSMDGPNPNRTIALQDYTTHPNYTDTDGDASTLDHGVATDATGQPIELDDYQEVTNNRSYKLDVKRKDEDGDGIHDDDPIRYDYADEVSHQNLEVSHTNPLAWDSDGDGVGDGEELSMLRTDPNAVDGDGEAIPTYEITHQHESDFVEALSEEPSRGRFVRILDLVPGCSGWLGGYKCDLDDGSDDFDLIYQSSDVGLDMFRYRKLGTKHGFVDIGDKKRTVTWFGNAAEVDEVTDSSTGSRGRVSTLGSSSEVWTAWDADTDNDGLSDGREGGDLDPTDPDSDGDGYWDGRVGVYDIGYAGGPNTDHLILYQDHLQSGSVSGDRAVPEQIEAHSGHSKLHIGEKTWGTDPTGGSTPKTDLTVEVDFTRTSHHQKINNSGWEQAVENNFAMYGINVDIIRDEVVDYPSGWEKNETTAREVDDFDNSIYKDEGADTWMLVAKSGGDGINLHGKNEMIVWTEGPYYSSQNNYTAPYNGVNNSPHQNQLSWIHGKVAVHEIGHSFSFGEADDRNTDISFPGSTLTVDEVYSGESEDRTKEKINKATWWSVMSKATKDPDLVVGPLDGSYIAFSVEESVTAQEAP